METKVEILIDEETDTFRIEGEHSLTFYAIWNDMMLQAMAKEREAILQLLEAAMGDEQSACYFHAPELYSVVEKIKARSHGSVQNKNLTE